MKIKSEEIDKGLRQLVEIKFLQKVDDKYKYHQNYKKILLNCVGKSKEEILLNALWKAGYFKKPKTERETKIVCNLLLLE